MKLRSLLLVPLLTLVMGFTDAKVNTSNVDTLNASLQTMLAPLPRAQQHELMTAFFEISSGVFWMDDEESLASGYLVHQRFGSNYPRINGFGQRFGISSRESMANFINKFGGRVNGKSGHQIIAEAKAKSAAREARYDEHARVNGPRFADELEIEIRRYERFLPQRRAEVEATFQENNGKAERGLARVKLVKVNQWDVIRDRVYGDFEIEVDTRTELPLRRMHVNFFIHHKGNVDQRGGGAAFIIKGEDVPAHKAGVMRFNTGEMSFGVATINHPKSLDDWEIVPFVSQIDMRRKTDYLARSSDIYESLKDGSGKDRGIAMTYCDAAIGQAKLNVLQLRAGVRGDNLDTEHWKHAKYYCELGRRMERGGSNPITTPIYVPSDSALASTIGGATISKPPAQSNAGSTELSNAAASGNATVDRLNNALGYIRIQDIEDFRIGPSPINPEKTKIVATMKMAIHNIPAKGVKRARFGILVQLKSDPSQKMLIGRTYSPGNQPNSDRIMKVSLKQIEGSSASGVSWTSTNPNDYIFTPYLKEIQWLDRTGEKYVRTTNEIVGRITDP